MDVWKKRCDTHVSHQGTSVGSKWIILGIVGGGRMCISWLDIDFALCKMGGGWNISKLALVRATAGSSTYTLGNRMASLGMFDDADRKYGPTLV